MKLNAAAFANALVSMCPACGGTSNKSVEGYCSTCEGTGIMPTPLGEVFIGLMNRQELARTKTKQQTERSRGAAMTDRGRFSMFNAAMRAFIKVAEHNDQLQITLTVGGMMVSGRIVDITHRVAEGEHTETIADVLSAIEGKPDLFGPAFQEEMEAATSAAGSPATTESADMIFLEDVTLLLPSGEERHLPRWAGRIDAVDGYWLGASPL